MRTATIAQSSGSIKRPHWRLRVTFWLDFVLLISVSALQAVSFTGLVLHEWLGILIIALILTHLLLAWSWIASQTRRIFAVQSIRARINYLLNLSLFAAVIGVIFSGILISQKAVPALTGAKLQPEINWRWDMLHVQWSQFVLLLAGFHVALNLDWILAAVEKLFRRYREGSL